jgi:type VI secretion system secreted protein VgrG
LQDAAEDIRRFCAEHGYGVDGITPDNSYGNDVSNIARLYDLYMDQADETLAQEADEAAVKVYLEGVGTVSAGEDLWYAQGTGRWGTGVLARVGQAPTLIFSSVRRLKDNNLDVRIKRIEVDIFGFSRGAAAARHFANDLLKGSHSLLAKVMPAGSSMLVDEFAWRVQHDVRINFIGLFDTVAGIIAPLAGDFSPGNARNPGLDLALPANAARKIVQLVARDEYRFNFALTRTDNDIILPGAHSDIGGGYLPRVREKLLMSKPVNSLELQTTSNERSRAYIKVLNTQDPRLRRLVEQGFELKPAIWSVDLHKTRDELYQEKRVYAAIRIDREVDGDLSKVYLRVMRELGLRHEVPFKRLPNTSALALPVELLPIWEKIQTFALGKSSDLNLSESEEALLLRRYIHLSANWNAINNWSNSDLEVVFINRPTDNHERVVHANK